MKKNSPKKFDVIVIGVGGMGSSACYHLAKRGQKVLGLEQFSMAHDKGSSHGETRMIRRAYFEHPNYVPLLNRAYALWETLEKESKESLLVKNGLIIYANPKTSTIYRGTTESARKHTIPIEKLDTKEANKRFSMYRCEKTMSGILEPGAGFLRVEKCVNAHTTLAKKHGAVIHENETVTDYRSTNKGVIVGTNKGSYTADRLIITGGPWNTKLLGELGTSLKLFRTIQYWFKASADFDVKTGIPCFAFHTDDDFYYGFPMLDGKTIKVAAHFSKHAISDPAEKNIHEVPTDELKHVQKFLKEHLPKVSTSLDRFSPCIYTMTPDEHFIIDRHPQNDRITFAGGFSGHGFKFSSVIGEILADLSMTGITKHPIEFLKLRKF